MCGICGCGDRGDGGGGIRIAVPHTGDGEPAGYGRPHDDEHGHAHGHAPVREHDGAHAPVHERADGRAHASANGHAHAHDGGHPHDGAHTHAHETVTLEQRVLAKNDSLAGRNRAWLAERGIVAVNLMSSPGAGKTTLLERTITELAGRRPVAVVEGDQETTLDADRIRRTGCAVVQVNTGAGCHLDAEMTHRALTALSPAPGSLVLVENVGNLVCPALFDLGEHSKVVVISVTEGTDKPLKYPHMFAAADLVVVNKTDLLPYVDFDVERCEEYARSVNPRVRVLAVSATTGDGMSGWYDWVAAQDAGRAEGRPAGRR